jgi:hypothetical protein
MNLSLILSLLGSAGTIEASVSTAITNFTALVTAAEGALPQIKTFVAALEGDAKTQFEAVISAFETLVTSTKTAVSDVTSTVSAVTSAVASTTSTVPVAAAAPAATAAAS